MNWIEFISIPMLYRAWCDFSRGKRAKADVAVFESSLENELWSLYCDLRNDTYQHSVYTHFRVRDPKERNIHKAAVRDRVVHRLLYNELLPLFHKRWLDCSFSCRPGFGQHRSVRYIRRIIARASKNYTVPCFAVKLDIRKFFENIDHDILLRLSFKYIEEPLLRDLLMKVVRSYSMTPNRGLPIGNLTSQIFANIFLHELDWFVKQKLKKKFYARYADDFICLVESQAQANDYITAVTMFLHETLQISVHPRKIIIRQIEHGIDWLGVVILPNYSVLRPTTRRRMLRRVSKLIRINDTSTDAVRSVAGSYNGLMIGVARKNNDQNLNQLIALIDAGALE